MEERTNGANILVVDDEIGPRESLRLILKPNYNIFTAKNGYEAIQMVQQTEFDAITLDLKMPGMSGIDTFKEIRKYDPDVAVIIITGYGTLQSAIDAIRYDVFDYLSKPFNVKEIISIIDKSVQRRRLNLKVKWLMRKMFDGNQIDEKTTDPESFLLNKIRSIPCSERDRMGQLDTQTCLEFAKVLSYHLEEKDPYTAGHSERVCFYSDSISKQLSFSQKERGELQIASYLHDIGKIGISNRFLNKKGPLNSTDWAIVKQHPKKSVELLAPLKLSPHILSSILHHHEHFDGTGYPDGLKKEQIPLGARIIGISDSYEGMTSNRPHRKPLSKEEVKDELLGDTGKQFDPQLVSILLDILKDKEEVFLVRDLPKAPSLSYSVFKES
jgi:response regulator RpfG family c-di-GMP phosphodiesterase